MTKSSAKKKDLQMFEDGKCTLCGHDFDQHMGPGATTHGPFTCPPLPPAKSKQVTVDEAVVAKGGKPGFVAELDAATGAADALFRYVQEETVLRDCGQRGVCRTPPGCARHWEERNRELARENAALSSQVESMSMRIETLAEELAKPEDVRLREVLDALDGRAVIFDGLGARVGHLLDEMDEWIGRAGEAERMVESARRSLASVADHMTDHAYQELASALESPPRIAVVVPVEVHEHGWQWRPTATDTAFAPPFGTIRQCRVCGCLVAGGPTACARCAEAGS